MSDCNIKSKPYQAILSSTFHYSTSVVLLSCALLRIVLASTLGKKFIEGTIAVVLAEITSKVTETETVEYF